MDLSIDKDSKITCKLLVEDIDLTLKPNVPSQHEGLIPIWSLKDFSRSNREYRIIEIPPMKIDLNTEFDNKAPSEEHNENSTVATIENNQTPIDYVYTCNLCNINVPMIYKTQHSNSFKHKTHLNIVNIALERIREQLIERKDYAEVKTNTGSTNFCDSCEAVLDVNIKHEHEESTDHKLSTIYDQLRVLLYTDHKNATGSNDNKIMRTNDDIFGLAQKIVAHNVRHVNQRANNIEIDLRTTLDLQPKNDNISPVASKKIRDNNNWINNRNKHDAALVTVKNKPTKNNNYIVFNRSFETGSSIQSKNENDIDLVNHSDVAAVKLNNNDAKTSVTNSSANINPNEYICKICNAVVPNLSQNIIEHKLGSHHIKMLNKNSKIKSNDSKVNVSNEQVSVLNNEIVDDNKRDIHNDIDLQVFLSSQANNNVKNEGGVTRKDSGDKSNNTVVTNSITDTVKNEYRCKLCDVVVPNSPRNITDHNLGTRHKTMLNNTATKTDKNKVNHLNSKIEVLHKDLVRNNKSDINQDVDIQVPATTQSNDTVNVLGVATNKISYECNDNTIVTNLNIDKAKNQYRCKLCDVGVPNSPRNITEHNLGTRHKTMLNNKETKTDNNKVKLTNDKIETLNKEIVRNKDLQSSQVPVITTLNNNDKNTKIVSDDKSNDSTIVTNSDTNTVKEYICEVCDVVVPNLPQNITEHNLGTRHKTILNKATNTAKEYICEICDVVLTNSPRNITVHNLGTRHMTMLNNKETKSDNNKVKLTNDKIKTLNKEIVGNKDLQSSQVPVNTTLNNNDKNTKIVSDDKSNDSTIVTNSNTNTVKEYICEICDVVLTNSSRNITEHNLGTRHMTMLNNKETKTDNNKVKLTNDKIETLNKEIVGNKDLQSSQVPVNTTLNNNDKNTKIVSDDKSNDSTIVTNSNTNTVKEYICEICDVVLTNSSRNITEHNLGTRHMTMLNNKETKTDNNKVKLTNDKIETLNKETVGNKDLQSSQVPVITTLNNNDKNTKIVSDDKSNDSTIVTNSDTNTVKEYICEVCDVVVPNLPQNITEHNLGTRHKTILNKATNTVKEYICEVCDVVVPNLPQNITEHNLGTRHKTMLNNKVTKTDNKVKLTNDKIEMLNKEIVGNKDLESLQVPVNITLNNNDKNTKIVSDDKSNDSTIVTNSNTNTVKEYICEICDVVVPNSPRTITEHNLGTRHKTILNNKATNKDETVDVTEKISNEKETKNGCVAITENDHNKRTVGNIITKWYECKLCNLHLHNDPQIIKEHNNGNRHNKILCALIESQLIEEDIKGYYCNVCDCLLPEKDFLSHLAEKHQADLEEMRQIRHNAEIQKNRKHIWCAICNKQVLNNKYDKNLHVDNDLEHKDLFELILSTNHIRSSDGYRQCDSCGANYYNMGEEFFLEHVKSIEHRYTSRDPSLPVNIYVYYECEYGKMRCVVCGICVPARIEWLENHLKSVSHLKRFRLLDSDTKRHIKAMKIKYNLNPPAF